MWILMDGVIHHDGAHTSELLEVLLNQGAVSPWIARLCHIDSTFKEDYYPLWPVVTADTPNATASLKSYFEMYNLHIITEDMALSFAGDPAGNKYATLKLLEWQVPTRH